MNLRIGALIVALLYFFSGTASFLQSAMIIWIVYASWAIEKNR